MHTRITRFYVDHIQKYRIHISISTENCCAISSTRCISFGIAFFAKSWLHNTIAAEFELTQRTAAIIIQCISIIALLIVHRFQCTVATDVFTDALLTAAIARCSITIITMFPSIQEIVTTQIDETVCATIARNIIPIIAFLSALHLEITAVGLRWIIGGRNREET
ncbi:hypothetical protein A2765_01225 [Candidatus Kaiserbacteria bacterium RIFCSPHIGHO2_01_FULL_56_24]|uniref:Uncharacterized protein n=1 Tax=Candidatus Kaiserbacteria bacterium RIFCSPHIGHO2_01_FULL_56_24 TaxID=1798487 RepID=A0A1F6DG86_9BACT|nr:MAG: hypothetical protein A2765_01225 [Candidatus Kaiserbacteria bacterium RIFCSPHIGHO2_01_FULL_56_24]